MAKSKTIHDKVRVTPIGSMTLRTSTTLDYYQSVDAEHILTHNSRPPVVWVERVWMKSARLRRPGALVMLALMSLALLGCPTVVVEPTNVDVISGTLSADRERAWADGIDGIQFRFEYENAAELQGVLFTINGPAHIEPVLVMTDERGFAEFELTTTTPGMYTIRIGGQDESSIDVDPVSVLFAECLTKEDSYATLVMGPVMATCQGCHNRFGRSAEMGSMTLSYIGDADHISKNIETMKGLLGPVETESGPMPYLLAKPLGLIDHAGGRIFSEHSPEAIALRSFIDILEDDDQCSIGTFPEIDLENDLEAATYVETSRKAVFDLTGHMPTRADIEQMDESPESLNQVLDYVMARPEFYDRLGELLNDEFLTDKYNQYFGAVYALNQERWKDRTYFHACYLPDVDPGTCCTENCCDDNGGNADGYCDAGREYLLESLSRMSIDFYTYILRNQRPATELLTADYAVVNRYNAAALGVYDAQFSSPRNDARWDLAQGHLQPSNENSLTEKFEHAGLLTTPHFLHRYPNGDTNLNRHRARTVYEKFLAVDVMDFLNFSIDANEDLGEDPFRDARSCSACHAALDPVAGTFKNYAGFRSVYEEAEWHDWLRAPGFQSEDTPDQAQDSSLRWLAQQVVEDERFALSQVELFFTALTDRKRLKVPLDPMSASYRARVIAFLSQDRYLESVRKRFVENGYRLDLLMKDIIAGPYYRAKEVVTTSSMKREAIYEMGIGGGMALRPEQLTRKLVDTFGMWWAQHDGRPNELTTDYRFRFLYGGMDSGDVTTRFREPTPVQQNINRRMSLEMACNFVPHEFSFLNAGHRRLLSEVETWMQPEDENGAAIETHETAIRATIADLHLALLHQDLEPNDIEIDDTYKLFVKIWRQGREGISSGALSSDVSYACRVRGGDDNWDRLPASSFATQGDSETSLSRTEISRDENYIIRAWMGVFVYLMSDYQFFFH